MHLNFVHLHFVHNLYAFLFWYTKKKDDVLKNISSFFVHTKYKPSKYYLLYYMGE